MLYKSILDHDLTYAYMGSFGGHDKGVQLEALLLFIVRIKIENHQQ